MKENATMPLWKKVLLRTVGLGAGFALTLSAVIGLWLWWGTRPKPEPPWNTNAIKATWTDLSLSTQSEKCYFNFRYSLENTTDRDYTIPHDARLMVRRPKDMSFQENSDLNWEQGGFVPSRQKLNIQIRIPFNYSDYNISKEKLDNLKELSKFADRRLSEIDGFALFDPVNRFRVDFPNGWPDSIKRVQEEQSSN